MTLEEALDEIRRRDEIIASNKTLVEDLRIARYALDDYQQDNCDMREALNKYKNVPSWIVSLCNGWRS